jgi:hypothetical protein
MPSHHPSQVRRARGGARQICRLSRGSGGGAWITGRFDASVFHGSVVDFEQDFAAPPAI